MTALNRKLLRDVWHMRAQAVAIGLVMACGVATFVTSLSTMESLRLSQEVYYRDFLFGQIFAQLKRAPNSLAGRISSIPGVALVQTRVAVDVTLDVPGLAEPASGRLVSLPDHDQPLLNQIYVRRGRLLEAGASGEVLVSEAFFEANRLQLGDTVSAVINEKKQELVIVGVALSPEFVYTLRAGAVFPDDRRYGVFWMNRQELAAAFDMEGAFNDIVITLIPGASEQEVIDRVDRLATPFGCTGAYGRKDQISHWFLSNEMQQLQTLGIAVPIIFLGVAAFLLNVALSRLVKTQREEIGLLKAFGYRPAVIAWQYVKLSILLISLGVLAGTFTGAWMGRGMTLLYTQFFRFPSLTYRLTGDIFAIAVLVGVASALIGTLGAVRTVLRLPAAVAMRPAAPPMYRPLLSGRLFPAKVLSTPTRIIMRNLERHPLRAAMGTLGISLGVAILIVGTFMLDSIDYVTHLQFDLGQREDLTVTFVEPRAHGAFLEVTRLPGVMQAEPFRTVPVRIRHGYRERRLALTSVSADADLHRLIDVNGDIVKPSAIGVMLSRKLGEVLGAGLGDNVTVEVLEGNRPVLDVEVTKLIDDNIGTSAYMDAWELHRLLREPEVLSGAHLMVDPGQNDKLYKELKSLPGVAGVTLQKVAVQSFQETLAETLLYFVTFYAVLAALTAMGVVYNNARIALSERSRELASLRVLGFRRSEISYILLGELTVLTVVAIPVGFVLGVWLAQSFPGLDTELFRIPIVVESSTFAFAAIVVLLASGLTALLVRRRLDHLDLIGVLKTRE